MQKSVYKSTAPTNSDIRQMIDMLRFLISSLAMTAEVSLPSVQEILAGAPSRTKAAAALRPVEEKLVEVNASFADLRRTLAA